VHGTQTRRWVSVAAASKGPTLFCWKAQQLPGLRPWGFANGQGSDPLKPDAAAQRFPFCSAALLGISALQDSGSLGLIRTIRATTMNYLTGALGLRAVIFQFSRPALSAAVPPEPELELEPLPRLLVADTCSKIVQAPLRYQAVHSTWAVSVLVHPVRHQFRTNSSGCAGGG